MRQPEYAPTWERRQQGRGVCRIGDRRLSPSEEHSPSAWVRRPRSRHCLESFYRRREKVLTGFQPFIRSSGGIQAILGRN